MWTSWFCCFNFNTNPINKKHLQQHLLRPIQQVPDDQNDDVPLSNTAAIVDPMIFLSWIRCSTARYLILALCSPLILPLFCATVPLLCALKVFFRVCGRRKRRRRAVEGCGEGENGERLLQRYLEDQLILVAGSVYEYWDDENEIEEVDGIDAAYLDDRSPPLQ